MDSRQVGPSAHLTWLELACWNRLGRVYASGKPFSHVMPGELIAPYPDDCREDRALRLAETFEAVRELLGNAPIRINSAYRTEGYNRAVRGSGGSQHIQGRALDIVHPTIEAREMFAMIYDHAKRGALPHLGGVGSYRSFVHIDVRPKAGGHLAFWREE